MYINRWIRDYQSGQQRSDLHFVLDTSFVTEDQVQTRRTRNNNNNNQPSLQVTTSISRHTFSQTQQHTTSFKQCEPKNGTIQNTRSNIESDTRTDIQRLELSRTAQRRISLSSHQICPQQLEQDSNHFIQSSSCRTFQSNSHSVSTSVPHSSNPMHAELQVLLLSRTAVLASKPITRSDNFRFRAVQQPELHTIGCYNPTPVTLRTLHSASYKL